MKQLLYIVLACICLATTVMSCKTNTPVDASERITLPQDQFLRGQVTNIEHGKDGYTAIIQATDGIIYRITASIPNCGQHGVFKTVQIGDSIHVKGEMWMMGKQYCMTVRTFIQ